MMHPEYDPREQRRLGNRGAQRSHGDYRRRRYSDEEQRRRSEKDRIEGFDASMYDDHGLSSRQESMYSSSDERFNDDRNRTRRKDAYRLERNRSASPQRNDDLGRRQRTPPPSYKFRDPHPFPPENKGKELFLSKPSTDGVVDQQAKKLLSNKSLAAGLKKELFPQRGNSTNHHRRSDAFDAADETADLLATGLAVPIGDRSTERLSIRSRTTSYGRLKASDPESVPKPKGDDDGGISILGASNQQSPDFSIRGGATAVGTIRELFPGKTVGNGGKELFSEKLLGRNGRRNRASDMFH